jgi:DNA adenine methylase
MIPYLGNKSQLSDFLKQYVPKNPKIWVEPFGGVFGLFFTLDLKEYQDTQFIYNDINPLNCVLFENLKKKEFLDKVKSTNVTKEIFLDAYNSIVNQEENKKGKKVINVSNSEQRALAWLIILCCGDSKELMTKEFKGNSAFEILKYKLPRYIDYFKRIQVSNIDYKEVLKQHDSEDTFFYLDPPYVGFEDYYINSKFKGESHNELSKEVKDLKGKWLLSYYKFDKLEEMYSNYKIVSQRGTVSEEFLILGV